MVLFFTIISAFCVGCFYSEYATQRKKLTFIEEKRRDLQIRENEVEESLGFNPFEMVRELSLKANIITPKLIIPCSSPSEFAYVIDSGKKTEIYIGLSLLLNAGREVEGVIAHELGHIIGGSYSRVALQISCGFFFCWFIFAIIFIWMSLSNQPINPELAYLLPIFFGLEYIFRFVNCFLQRSEEYRADKIGLSLLDEPKDFIEWFEALSKKRDEINGMSLSILNSYPSNKKRSEAMKKILEQRKITP